MKLRPSFAVTRLSLPGISQPMPAKGGRARAPAPKAPSPVFGAALRCKLFGHDPVVVWPRAYCRRCCRAWGGGDPYP